MLADILSVPSLLVFKLLVYMLTSYQVSTKIENKKSISSHLISLLLHLTSFLSSTVIIIVGSIVPDELCFHYYSLIGTSTMETNHPQKLQSLSPPSFNSYHRLKYPNLFPPQAHLLWCQTIRRRDQ